MATVASILIDSPLPQLDRLFEYRVPVSLESEIRVGQRVEVTFGRSRKSSIGFVVELSDQSNFAGKLSELNSILSPVVHLKPEIYRLAQTVAERQSCQVAEVLKLAVPNFMPTVEKSFLSQNIAKLNSLPPQVFSWSKQIAATKVEMLIQSSRRSTLVVEPRTTTLEVEGKTVSLPIWVALFVESAFQSLKNGKSSILIVPDFRDVSRLRAGLSEVGLLEHVVDYSSNLVKSKRYLSFLSALMETPCVVIGTRSAIFAPVSNLGSILVWDEADSNLVDQSAPYFVYRDLALMRQQQEGCALVFASHSRSADIQRLVELNYLQDVTANFPIPRVSTSDPGLRLDSLSFNAIRQGLIEGPVLVQVSSKGDTLSIYCRSCEEVAHCHICRGPIRKNSENSFSCRWCNALSVQLVCQCKSTDFRFGRPGSSRTASELGKSFPGSKVVEATGEKIISRVSGKNTLVVATPGAEPLASKGYAAVIILDASIALSKQTLRSRETAVRIWSNAISLLSDEGRGVLAGITGNLATQFPLWAQREIASDELISRRELSFPPAVRLGSITAERAMLQVFELMLNSQAGVTVIGPAPLDNPSQANQWRLIFKYPHAIGLELAKSLKAESLKVSAGKTLESKSGRNTRSVRIKMDDTEVI